MVQPSGLAGYAKLPAVLGCLISADKATLHELKTVYSLEDAFLMMEVLVLNNTTTTNNRTTHIGQVVVQTQATDAQGIANSMGAALGNTVNQADGGAYQ